MSEWVSVKDRSPEDQQECLVWRKWDGWDEFGAEIDKWEVADDETGEGFWFVAEDWCQHCECAGNGDARRPVTTHWIPITPPPAEGE